MNKPETDFVRKCQFYGLEGLEGLPSTGELLGSSLRVLVDSSRLSSGLIPFQTHTVVVVVKPVKHRVVVVVKLV